MATLEERGVTVDVRDTFPMDTHGDVIGLIAIAELSDLQTCIPLLARVVTGWDRDEDPADEATWREMDALDVYPYARIVTDHLVERIWGEPKNGESASSST